MKGLFIYFDLSNDNINSVGIIKKVLSQYSLFNNFFSEGCDIYNLPLKGSKKRVFRLFKYLFCKKAFDFKSLENKKYDCIYIRRITPNCLSVIYLLKSLRKVNCSSKIVYEIPTYPYDFEHKTIQAKILLYIDKIYRKKLSTYIDRIVTLTDDKQIFGCETLKITNGVDLKSIPICKKDYYDLKKINLIAVAQFSFWHGYERVIEGIYKYGKEDVILHLVGNGAELEKYRSLVKRLHLERQVIFYGALSGDELTKVFDIADVAICSLACHRINLQVTSVLKSREYLSRALPIITSAAIDIIPKDFKYVLRVPEDDTPIDIEKIVSFSNNLYSEDGKNIMIVRKEIRSFAEDNCGMDKAMKNVLEYFN